MSADRFEFGKWVNMPQVNIPQSLLDKITEAYAPKLEATAALMDSVMPKIQMSEAVLQRFESFAPKISEGLMAAATAQLVDRGFVDDEVITKNLVTAGMALLAPETITPQRKRNISKVPDEKAAAAERAELRTDYRIQSVRIDAGKILVLVIDVYDELVDMMIGDRKDLIREIAKYLTPPT